MQDKRLDGLLAQQQTRPRTHNALCLLDGLARAILDVLQDCILITDDKGTILAANKAASQYLGLPGQQLLHMGLEKVLPSSGRGTSRKGLDLTKLRLAIETATGQKTVYRRAGQTLEALLQPVEDPCGGARVIIVVRPVQGPVRTQGHARDLIRGLTEAERKVLRLIMAGKSNKQIAIELHRSRRTIENHRAQVMKKLRVRSLALLIKKVQRIGL